MPKSRRSRGFDKASQQVQDFSQCISTKPSRFTPNGRLLCFTHPQNKKTYEIGVYVNPERLQKAIDVVNHWASKLKLSDWQSMIMMRPTRQMKAFIAAMPEDQGDVAMGGFAPNGAIQVNSIISSDQFYRWSQQGNN